MCENGRPVLSSPEDSKHHTREDPVLFYSPSHPNSYDFPNRMDHGFKKKTHMIFIPKLTYLENAAVKGIVSRVTTLPISPGPFIWWGSTDPHGANKQKRETTLVLEIEISQGGDNCRTGSRQFPVCKIIDYFFTSWTVRMQLWHTSHYAWCMHTYLVTWSCPIL